MSSSIKAGIASLDENVDAAMILLVDQPFITTELLDRLIEEMEISDHDIVAPR
jgi:CTP:molybdopterin cytidylyltransferase MocA